MIDAKTGTHGSQPLSAAQMWLAAISVAIANFLVVLDTTITNVSIPTISGSLGVSSSQGTWIITSYAVAEAITLPLTAWLAIRYGEKRVFIVSYIGFTVFSAFCAISTSLGMLITGRVLLGLIAGPIMPLSLILLVRIFPKEKATNGMVLWAMTSLLGPIAGPILGGILSDTWGWHWIFLINVPVGIGGSLLAIYMLRGFVDKLTKASVDVIGLILLIIWVAALQIVLDEGRNHDWFASTEVLTLAIVAAIGFIAFLIWELTEKNPIINLHIFRYRGFTVAVITYGLGFLAFNAILVLLPLWLQQNMGYTATWAGLATGLMGVLALVSAPIVGKMVEWFDPRAVVFVGIAGLGLVCVWRMTFTSEVTFMQMAWPTLLTGPFLVMFFIPITGIILASVPEEDQVTASGVSNFLKTLAGAFGTSLVQTGWSDATRTNQSELVGATLNPDGLLDRITGLGITKTEGIAGLNAIFEGQSVMLATLNMFGAIALAFFFAAFLIWLVPKPTGPINTAGAH